jgi:hypothetical protein
LLEYIFSTNECRAYLRAIDINVDTYAIIYIDHIYPVVEHKKKARKMNRVTNTDISGCTNIMSLKFYDRFNNTTYYLPNTITYLCRLPSGLK